MVDDSLTWSGKMHPVVVGQFSKRTIGGRDRDDDIREVSNAWDEVGAWSSSVGPCRIQLARSKHNEFYVSSSKSSEVRNHGKNSARISESVFESIEVDKQQHPVRSQENRGDSAIAALENLVGKSPSVRRRHAESYIDLYQNLVGLDDGVVERLVGNENKMRTLSGLADPRVSSFHALDGRVLDVFGENATQRGVSHGLDVFKRLDDCAEEVLRKSMQSLASDQSLISAGPKLRSRWARDVFQEGYVPSRRDELIETSSDVTFATMVYDLKDFISIKGEVSDKIDSREKAGGAFSDKTLSYHTKDKLPEDWFVEFEKDESSSYKPPSPSVRDNDLRHSGMESNSMDFTIEDDNKGEDPHRRVCKWATLSATQNGTKKNTTNQQISSNCKEEVYNNNNLSQDCIIDKSYQCTPKLHKQENECEACVIHRKLVESVKDWEEKIGYLRKPPESIDCKMKTHDCGKRQVLCVTNFAQGLLVSSQGASIAPSETDPLQNYCIFEGENIVDTLVEIDKNLEVNTAPAISQRREKDVSPQEQNAGGTGFQHVTSYEKRKLGPVSLRKSVTFEAPLQDDRTDNSLDWTVECVGSTTTRPSTHSVIHKPRNSPVKNVTEVQSARPSVEGGCLRIQPESLPATPSTSRRQKLRNGGLRSPHRCKSLLSPTGTSRRNHSGTKGLKSQSETTHMEANRTGNKEKQAETLKQGISSQGGGTTVTVNISVIPFKEKEEASPMKSAETNYFRKSTEGKYTEIPISTRIVQISPKIKDLSCVKSTQTIEPSTQKPQIVGTQPLDKVCTIHKELTSMETLPVSNMKPLSQEDRRWWPSRTTSSSGLDTLPRFSDKRPDGVKHWPSSGLDTLPRFSDKRPDGVKHWPRVIPDLDNWILEVVSRSFGTEECRLRVPHDTSATVNPGGSVSVVSVNNHGNHATSFRVSSLQGPKPPSILDVPNVITLLDRQTKRLAELDSKICKAHSVKDLFQILEGVSTIQSATVQSMNNTVNRQTNLSLQFHEFEKDEIVQKLLKQKSILESSNI